jgi:hypothetical protein
MQADYKILFLCIYVYPCVFKKLHKREEGEIKRRQKNTRTSRTTSGRLLRRLISYNIFPYRYFIHGL